LARCLFAALAAEAAASLSSLALCFCSETGAGAAVVSPDQELDEVFARFIKK
jgi:hypothetical protein